MPVTRGSGNPIWTRDETILALDLLYRMGTLDQKHPEVISLSNLLRAANLVPIDRRKDNFRNADGVALKLQNLRSVLEPSRALSASKTDRSVVADFPRTFALELAVLASGIREILGNPTIKIEYHLEDDDDVFIEGRIQTSRHKSRERILRQRLLKKTSDERLVCTICAYAPPDIERDLRESFFEAHHILPLAASTGIRQTKVSDLVLLCAGCHRFLHKLIVRKRAWLTIEDAKNELGRT
jgi:5-methylcytosine-specific restriction protein A